MAAMTRPSAQPPAACGSLLASETPPDADARVGKVFERIVPAPTAFLRWLIANADQMECANDMTFGSRDPKVQQWRRKLLRGSAEERTEARAEGLRALDATPPNGRQGKWWLFEGRSHIDCCFITESTVLFVEGKRTESVSAATQWFSPQPTVAERGGGEAVRGWQGLWGDSGGRER
jgi:hypothetical protein